MTPNVNTVDNYSTLRSLHCDGRKLPSKPGQNVVSPYWEDECGYHMTPEFVDGDPKSIAIMPPVLPISRRVYRKDGQSTKEIVLHCYDSYNTIRKA